MADWDLTFFRQFPEEMCSYLDSAKALITNFGALVMDSDITPDVVNALGVLKDRIDRTFNLLRSETDSAFDDMKTKIRESHKEGVPAVQRELQSMYTRCAAEAGKSICLSCFAVFTF